MPPSTHLAVWSGTSLSRSSGSWPCSTCGAAETESSPSLAGHSRFQGPESGTRVHEKPASFILDRTLHEVDVAPRSRQRQGFAKARGYADRRGEGGGGRRRSEPRRGRSTRPRRKDPCHQCRRRTERSRGASSKRCSTLGTHGLATCANSIGPIQHKEEMDDPMSDKRAAEYYEDPEHLRVRPGSGRRRSSSAPKSLGSHVPVRFSVTDIERIRTAAREDGRTVSSWIRWLVQRELDRRSPIR